MSPPSPTPGPHAADGSVAPAPQPSRGDCERRPDAQLRLLDLQALDTALDQLAHRRRTLPELADDRRRSRRASRELRDRDGRGRDRGSDLEREQNEGRARRRAGPRPRRPRPAAARLRRRWARAKELENLQPEIASLPAGSPTSRRSSWRSWSGARTAERRAQRRSRRTGTTCRRSSPRLEQAPRRRVRRDRRPRRSWPRADRAGVATGIPADLLTLYEKLRGRQRRRRRGRAATRAGARAATCS